MKLSFTPAVSFFLRCTACLLGVMLGAGEMQTQAQSFFINTNYDVSFQSGNETDPAVAINPHSPTNVFIVSVNDAASGLFTSFAVDATTWNTTTIASSSSTTLTPAYGEPTVTWDGNSNLFMAYIPAAQQGLAVAISTNGGSTFTMLTNLFPNDVIDQPRIVNGPGYISTNGTTPTNNFYNVWLVYKDFSLINAPLVAQGLITTNRGTNGLVFSPQYVLPGSIGSTNGAFPDISCGPSNQVMVAYQNNNYSSARSRVYVNVNTNILGTNGFGGPVEVTPTNSPDAVGGYTYIAADDYGNGVNAGVGVVWDQNPTSAFYGRAYVAYTAIASAGLPMMNIVTRSSTTTGRTWGTETVVNDDSAAPASHFFPRIALDNATGGLALCWYDCRNDNGSGPQTLTVPVTGTTNFYTNIFDLDNTPNDDYMVYTTTSLNGGASYAANQSAVPIWTVAALKKTSIATGANFTYVTETGPSGDAFGVGSHIGLAFSYRDFYPVWPDGSYFIPNNPGPGPGSNYDLYISEAILPTANLGISITHTPANPISAENITYNVVVTNSGPFPATNYVVTNILPANVTIVTITPAPGTHATLTTTSSNQVITFIYSASGSLALGGTATNVVRVTTGQSGIITNTAILGNFLLPDPVAVNNTATDIVAIGVEDLGIFVTTSTNTANISTPVIFTLTVTNYGPGTNGLVFITNGIPPTMTQVTNITVPAGDSYLLTNNQLIFSLGTLNVGQTSTVSFSALTASPNLSYQTVTNIALVGSTAFDTNPSNNIATNLVPLLGEDLAMGMTSSEANVGVGDVVTFLISITNLGPSSTGNLVLTNKLSDNLGQISVFQFPPGSGNLIGNTLSFNMGQLAVNQVATIGYTATALSVDSTDTNIVNSVTVSSSDFDTNLLNNIVTLNLPLFGEELAVGVVGNPNTVPVGQTITFTELLTNQGLSSAGIVNVTNYLTNLNNVTVVQAPGTNYFDPVANALVFQLGQVPSGQVVPIIFTATPMNVGLSYVEAEAGSDVFETNYADDYLLASNVIVAQGSLVSNFSIVAGGNSALISWDTPFNTTAQISYGLTSNYGNITSLSPSSMHHAFHLSGLLRDTNYYFAASTWGSGVYGVTNGSFYTTNTIVLNTQDASYNGTWSQGSLAVTGFYGSYFNTANTAQFSPTASANYSPSIPATGQYNVSIWYPQSTNFATNTLIYVTGTTNTSVTNVNQTTNGNGWRSLATNVYYSSGVTGGTTVYNTAQTNKLVVANAMRWSYIATQDYPSNGVPPAWWIGYYFGTNYAAALSNYSAYVFGTVPGSNDSPNFWYTTTSSNLTVTFTPCIGGRLYQLQTSSNLAKPWISLTNSCYVDTNANGIYSNGTGYGYFTLSQTNTNCMLFRISASVLQQ